MVTVLLFASARVAAEKRQMCVNGTSAAAVIQALLEIKPALAPVMPHCSVMIDGVRVLDLSINVDENSEVAILPPVSGGAI